MKISALILAKSDSKRLPDKNIMKFCGKPMFLWNVEKCLGIFEESYVSSDSEQILALTRASNGKTIKRPIELCGETPNIPVYQHAQAKMKADIIVAVQANSPTIETGLIEMVKDIMLSTGSPELMTCHEDYSIYGSIWALTKERLKEYKDFYNPKPDILIVDTSIDIHTLKDFKKAEEQWLQIQALS